MKKLIVLFLLVQCVNLIFGQAKEEIVIGKMDSIHSEILNEKRKIWVYVPKGDDLDIYTPQRYPVVYLLDGDGHFFSVAGMIRQLSTINGNTICPKMIVVGIPNTNRTRDLTPSKAEPNPALFLDKRMAANSGGGENFMSFIEKELMPHIEANYPTEPYRMLIGHSLGGLTVMNTFFEHNKLFNAYVALDPSMSWNNQRLLKAMKEKSIGESYKGSSLYLGIANTLEEGMDTLAAKKDETFPTFHIRSILELNTYLKRNSHINYRGKYYENDTHGSVPLIATYDALRFLFDFYSFKMGMMDMVNPESNFAAKIENHYERVSEKMGYPKKPDESYMNNMGYQFLQMGQKEKSEQLFKLNIAYYPNSFNVYDSMGDYYLRTENKEDAIVNFKKALSIKENPMSRKKLEELLAK